MFVKLSSEKIIRSYNMVNTFCNLLPHRFMSLDCPVSYNKVAAALQYFSNTASNSYYFEAVHGM